MCIIIDAKPLSAFLKNPYDEDMEPIRSWLEEAGRIVYSTGDKFSTEIQTFARKRLSEYVQKGKARFVPDKCVSTEVKKLCNSGLDIKSDDCHVLALARIAKVRLLYAQDHKLHRDFKNPEIIPPPRGHIYQGKQHRHLLTNSICG